ncbi:hypothetical protein Emed_004945 [Eimeria media]
MNWSVCYERFSSSPKLLPPRGPRRWTAVARLGAAVSLQQEAAAAAAAAAAATGGGDSAAAVTLRLAFSPCGSMLAACSSWGGLSVWDVECGSLLLQQPLLLPAAATALSWHCSGAYLWLGCMDGSLLLLPLRARPFSSSLQSPRGLFVAAFKDAHQGGVMGVTAVAAAAAAADAAAATRLAWSVGRDGFLRLWDLRQQRSACVEVYGHSAAAAAVAAAPDGTAVASAGGDGLLRLWGGPSLRLLKTTDGVGGPPLSSVAWSQGGAHILCTRSSSSSSTGEAAAAATPPTAAAAATGQQQEAFPNAKIWNLRCMGLAAAANAAGSLTTTEGEHEQRQHHEAAAAAARSEVEAAAAADELLDWSAFERPFVSLFTPRPTSKARHICGEAQHRMLQEAAAAAAAAADPAAAPVAVASSTVIQEQQHEQQQQADPQQQATCSDFTVEASTAETAQEEAAAAATAAAAAAAEEVWGDLLPSGAFWRDRVLLPAAVGCCCCFTAAMGDIEQLLLRPCCYTSTQQQQQHLQRLGGVVSVHPDWEVGVAASASAADGCITLWALSAATHEQADEEREAELRILKASTD